MVKTLHTPTTRLVEYTSLTAKKKDRGYNADEDSEEKKISCRKVAGKYARVVIPKSNAVTMIPTDMETAIPPPRTNACT